jgi:multisubunit Na+/H+ antiporter MnhE subunit
MCIHWDKVLIISLDIVIMYLMAWAAIFAITLVVWSIVSHGPVPAYWVAGVLFTLIIVYLTHRGWHIAGR